MGSMDLDLKMSDAIVILQVGPVARMPGGLLAKEVLQSSVGGALLPSTTLPMWRTEWPLDGCGYGLIVSVSFFTA